MKITKKFRNSEKVLFGLEKRFRSSEIACWNKWERLFLNLPCIRSVEQTEQKFVAFASVFKKYKTVTSQVDAPLFEPSPHFFRFSKTQYSPDIMQKFAVLKKLIDGYILKNVSFRRKMRTLKLSHSAENVKMVNRWAF